MQISKTNGISELCTIVNHKAFQAGLIGSSGRLNQLPGNEVVCPSSFVSITLDYVL